MTTHRSAAGLACAAAAILLGLLAATFLGLPANATPRNAPSWAEDYSPCVTEDSDGPCYWDASTRSNGRGRSFIVLADGTVDYSAAEGRRCSFYVDGRAIVVVARPDQDVAVRVNGRTIRRHTPHERVAGDVYVIIWTRGTYAQADVRAYVNGRRCKGA